MGQPPDQEGTSGAKPTAPSVPESLKTAIYTVLRPLVGLLMEHGLTFPWLSGVLKSVFVDVAEKEFRLPDKRQTDSRITLLTGVHRKDVRRIRRQEGGPPSRDRPKASISAPTWSPCGPAMNGFWTCRATPSR